MMRKVLIALGIACLLPSLAGTARAAPAPAGLRAWLQAVEAVPSAEALRKAGGAALEATLDAVVGDGKEAAYARHRALSFLAIAGTPAATDRLVRHLRIADADLRATAAIAWASGPVRSGDPRGWRELDRLLADPVIQVRTSAAQGLRLTGQPERSRERAQRRLAVETDVGVRKVLERLKN